MVCRFSNEFKLVSLLLVEMSSLELLPMDARVIVVAATNVPEVIDRSFMRAGRFSRFIFVGPPELEARCEILRMLFAEAKLQLGIEEQLARQCGGFTGADLKNLCYRAASIAAENDRIALGAEDFFAAVKQMPQKNAIHEDKFAAVLQDLLG